VYSLCQICSIWRFRLPKLLHQKMFSGRPAWKFLARISQLLRNSNAPPTSFIVHWQTERYHRELGIELQYLCFYNFVICGAVYKIQYLLRSSIYEQVTLICKSTFRHFVGFYVYTCKMRVICQFIWNTAYWRFHPVKSVSMFLHCVWNPLCSWLIVAHAPTLLMVFLFKNLFSKGLSLLGCRWFGHLHRTWPSWRHRKAESFHCLTAMSRANLRTW